MTDKELLKECKNFIDNYAMWEERDYDGVDLANKIEKQLSVPRVSKSVNCDLCGNTGYLIAENGEVGEDCYKCVTLTDISQQRELLLSYEEWLNEYNKLEDREKQVNKYLAK